MGIIGWLIPGLAVGAALIAARPPQQLPGGPEAALTVVPAGGLFGAAFASLAGLGEPTTFFVPATWAAALAGAALTALLMHLAARLDLSRDTESGQRLLKAEARARRPSGSGETAPPRGRSPRGP
jgi:hypothetical protein